MNSWDYERNTSPICPHCNHENNLWEQEDYTDSWLNEDAIYTLKCECCDKTFAARTGVVYQFCTAECEEAAECDVWGPTEKEGDKE